MREPLSVRKVELAGQEVRILWSDGHQSSYTARDLRVQCPCAQCVEEWTHRRLLDPDQVPHDLRAEEYLEVGRYALQFLWSDGHFTGIYPYETLRRLCQCPACRQDASE